MPSATRSGRPLKGAGQRKHRSVCWVRISARERLASAMWRQRSHLRRWAQAVEAERTVEARQEWLASPPSLVVARTAYTDRGTPRSQESPCVSKGPWYGCGSGNADPQTSAEWHLLTSLPSGSGRCRSGPGGSIYAHWLGNLAQTAAREPHQAKGRHLRTL
jgi:hypothetical protein